MAESKAELPPPPFKPTVLQNPDGTYTRFPQFQNTPPESDPKSSTSPVLTKDMSVNPNNQTWLRIFLPRRALVHSSSKFPLIVNFHGGGFVFLSVATHFHHDFCANMAARIDAVVVSVEYRLAPEHRLPAAYEDAIEALHCIKTSQESWLTEYADLSNCFLMGSSAGGNIAYRAGLLVSEQVEKLVPLKIKGLILHCPYFGGVERTGSELKMAEDPILPLSGSDRLWELALPVGADRDHEYSNPMAGDWSRMCKVIGGVDIRVLVTGCYGDPLIDREMEFGRLLKENGVATVTHYTEGCHTVEIADSSKADSLFLAMKEFTSN